MPATAADLRAERQQHLLSAKAIAESAIAEGRATLTPDEHESVTNKISSAKALERDAARAEKAAADADVLRQLDDLGAQLGLAGESPGAPAGTGKSRAAWAKDAARQTLAMAGGKSLLPNGTVVTAVPAPRWWPPAARCRACCR